MDTLACSAEELNHRNGIMHDTCQGQCTCEGAGQGRAGPGGAGRWQEQRQGFEFSLLKIGCCL